MIEWEDYAEVMPFYSCSNPCVTVWFLVQNEMDIIGYVTHELRMASGEAAGVKVSAKRGWSLFFPEKRWEESFLVTHSLWANVKILIREHSPDGYDMSPSLLSFSQKLSVSFSSLIYIKPFLLPPFSSEVCFCWQQRFQSLSLSPSPLGEIIKQRAHQTFLSFASESGICFLLSGSFYALTLLLFAGRKVMDL